MHGAGENRDRRLAGDKNGNEMKQVSDKNRVVELVKLSMRVTAVTDHVEETRGPVWGRVPNLLDLSGITNFLTSILLCYFN